MTTLSLTRVLPVAALTLFAWAAVLPTAALAQTPTPTEAVCYSRQDLAARGAGFVERVLVRDGAVVSKGTLLVELDNRLLRAAEKEARAAVQAAQGNVDLAADTLGRLQKLAGTDTVSEQELVASQIRHVQAKAQQAQAEAALERVRIQLADTRIKATVDGRVSGLPQVMGLYVQAGQSLGRVEASSSACAVSR